MSLSSVALPSYQLALLQSQWLKPARSRLLRMADIARAGQIVDLGCGWGQITEELADRSNGFVVGIDRCEKAIHFANNRLPANLRDRVAFVQADANHLPMDDQSIDIVFVQCGFLWMESPAAVLTECRRVLRSGGWLVALEPDFGGMMEYPKEVATRQLWVSALSDAGADPEIGRKLPSLCHEANFECSSYFLDRYEPPRGQRLALLKELNLDDAMKREILSIEGKLACCPQDQVVVHLPFWMVVARK